MNVPALSERTMRRDIASTDITIGSDIQVIIIIPIACSFIHACMKNCYIDSCFEGS